MSTIILDLIPILDRYTQVYHGIPWYTRPIKVLLLFMLSFFLVALLTICLDDYFIELRKRIKQRLTKLFDHYNSH